MQGYRSRQNAHVFTVGDIKDMSHISFEDCLSSGEPRLKIELLVQRDEERMNMSKQWSAECEVTMREVGRYPSNRKYLARRGDKYLDANFQEVESRERAYQHTSAIWQLREQAYMQGLVFERLIDPSVFEGGFETTPVTLEQIKEMPDTSRYYIKRKTPSELGFFYLNASFSGDKRSNAYGYKKESCIGSVVANSDIYEFELLPPMKQSLIGFFFNDSALKLIRCNMRSDMVRAFMMSKLGVMPPEELTSFDALQDWIEWNVACPGKQLTPQDAMEKMVNQPFECKNKVTEVSSGTCQFKIVRTGDWSGSISPRRFRELMRSCTTMSDVEYIINNEMAINYGIGAMINASEQEEITHRNTVNESVSRVTPESDFKQSLIQYLQSNMPEELKRISDADSAVDSQSNSEEEAYDEYEDAEPETA
jgi:hypothetical protein